MAEDHNATGLLNRRTVLIGLPLALAACGESFVSPQEDILRAMYVHDGPPALTLITVRNVDTGNGAHTALMINASQRVMFDPAGSFGHPTIPERNDVLFGITPSVEELYLSYHARATYYVVTQTLEVPPQTAEQALALALANGPVGKASCTRATSNLLRKLPGLEKINLTLLPDRLEMQFARVPGVVRNELREDDPDDARGAAILAYDAEVPAPVTQ
jgi:hypothetical protein